MREPAGSASTTACRGRHAGAEQQRLLCAFERRDHGLGLAHGGVVGPAVGIARAVLVVGVADEGCRHMQRRYHGLGERIDRAQRLRGQRAGGPAGRFIGHCNLQGGASHHHNVAPGKTGVCWHGFRPCPVLEDSSLRLTQTPSGIRGDERRGKSGSMAQFFSYALVPIAIIAVAIVLVFGLVNMMRGGSPQTSQKLMRLRVLMQFVAIIVIMIDDLGDGALKTAQAAWSSSTASIRAPATTAPLRSAPASGARNTICASPPMARSTRSTP